MSRHGDAIVGPVIDAPRQAVLDGLARAPGVVRSCAPATSCTPVAVAITGGGPFEADLATVRFVKERTTERRRLYYVTFEGVSALDDDRVRGRFAWVSVVEQHAGGWRTAGGSGGGDTDWPVPEPRVNLGGGGSPGFYAGGRVLSPGVDIARVRLTCANGLVLEDDTEGGVVLFITEQDATLPVTAELYDRGGGHVSSHVALPG